MAPKKEVVDLSNLGSVQMNDFGWRAVRNDFGWIQMPKGPTRTHKKDALADLAAARAATTREGMYQVLRDLNESVLTEMRVALSPSPPPPPPAPSVAVLAERALPASNQPLVVAAGEAENLSAPHLYFYMNLSAPHLLYEELTTKNYKLQNSVSCQGVIYIHT